MASLRNSFPLAIPAFHGDCLDVPRGLRARRVCGPSAGKRKSDVHGMAKRAAKLGVTVSHSCASSLEARQSGGYGWNAVAQSEFPLFRRETHRCPIERGRPTAAVGICYLSSLSVRAPSAHQDLRQSYVRRGQLPISWLLSSDCALNVREATLAVTAYRACATRETMPHCRRWRS